MDGAASGTVSGNTVNFVSTLSGGTPGRTGIRVRDTAGPVVDGNTITNDPSAADTGIDLGALLFASAAQVTNNSVCATGQDTALSASLNVLAGSRQRGGEWDHPAVRCGRWVRAGRATESGTVTLGAFGPFAAQPSYRVTEPLTVAGGREFDGAGGDNVDGQGNTVTVSGTMVVDGATVNDLVLTVAGDVAGHGGDADERAGRAVCRREHGDVGEGDGQAWSQHASMPPSTALPFGSRARRFGGSSRAG